MNKRLELNVVQNLQALLYIHKDQLPEKFKTDMAIEVDLLERYMLALVSEQGAPFWHELKADKAKYPTRRESNG